MKIGSLCSSEVLSSERPIELFAFDQLSGTVSLFSEIHFVPGEALAIVHHADSSLGIDLNDRIDKATTLRRLEADTTTALAMRDFKGERDQPQFHDRNVKEQLFKALLSF